MFRRATIFSLILITLLANFSRCFVFAGFELNQKYIAENLCVNKNRPWMHCDGHCYLMKKMKQAEEHEKKQATRNNLSHLNISFFQEPFCLTFISPVILENNKGSFPAYQSQYIHRYTGTIFQPPKQIA
ncbi:hypothetical protein [Pedobacter cryoconitis]|uniref:Uncharacterized protein n=1 Tax=Pedobacter cryoconitis TaxID=188932 RepID=A0A7X0MHS7_9SPHI|nr:hypothetical protein [Pedobacter cryoconitis]MBB6499652.1 hypothetical protein [Pedobacter cryoconitis]